MTARIVDADSIWQGDYIDAVVTIYNRQNQPVILPTGTVGAVIYEIFDNDKSTKALVTKGVGSGITVRPQTGGDIGVFDLVILSADTEPLSGDLYHECVVTVDAKPRTAFYGTFPVMVSPIK